MIRPSPTGAVRSAAMLGLALLPVLAQAGTVSLSEVWSRVQHRSPVLAAAVSGVRSAEAELGQARLLPNPELELMTVEYGRSEVEIGLTLPLEIGGRYRARVHAARAELTAARLGDSVTRLQLRAETLRRFSAALALKLKIEVADTLLDLLRSSTAHIAQRVDAGASMELDLVREQTELRAFEVEARGLERSYHAACRALASLGAEAPGIEWEPVGVFVGRPELPDRAKVLALVPEHPGILLSGNEVDAARAELAKARAEGFPEMALAGGYRRNSETSEGVVLLGASMSLPVFNLNQGAIKAARHAVSGAEHAAAGATLGRGAEAEQALAELAGLSESIDTGYAVILPAHRRVLNTLTRHYEQGAVGILEMIEAQRAFNETSMGLIDAMAERVSLVADLLEIAGVEPAVIKE